MVVSGYETYNSILNSGGIFAVVNFYIILVVISGIFALTQKCIKKKLQSNKTE